VVGAAPGALAAAAARRYGQARTLLTVLLTERTCPEFFTLPAYLRHLGAYSSSLSVLREPTSWSRPSTRV
jgi:hypothetical protein